MATKPRPPILRSIQTPEAQAALRVWLATFPPLTRDRGQAAFAHKQVGKITANADHFIEATLTEIEENFLVTLFFTRSQWNGKCRCSAKGDCRHIHATGLAWLAENEATTTPPASASPASVTGSIAITATPPSPLTPVINKHAFRTQWSPIIAEKLGRPLTEVEGRQLSNLAALFAEFDRGPRDLPPALLRNYGFDIGHDPRATLHPSPIKDWWDANDTPRDPWALWQYIAYAYERAGRAAPEVFRPLTDTRAVHSVVDDKLVQQELATWRTAFGSQAPTETPRTENPVTAIAGLRVRLGHDAHFHVEVRTADRPWKVPNHKWFTALASARPADFETLPPAQAALATMLAAEARGYGWHYSTKLMLTVDGVAALLGTAAARPAIVRPDEQPFIIEPEPLVPEASVSTSRRDRLELRLLAPDGRPADEAKLITAKPEPLYLFAGLIWRGPPALPARQIPAAVLTDAGLMSHLRAAGLRLPATLEGRVRRVPLQPVLKCWSTADDEPDASEFFHVQLLARSNHPPCEQQWNGDGWQWAKESAPARRGPNEPLLEFDLSGANVVRERFADFRLTWNNWVGVWARPMGKTFPEEFIEWRATLPPDLVIEASPSLEGLLGPPLQAHVEFSAAPAVGEGRDWFDLTVALRVQDTTFKPDELALLLKAKGKWVRLAQHGWRRLEVAAEAGSNTAAALDRLGLRTEDVLDTGRLAKHRLHTLQLAAEAETFAARDANLANELRTRAAALAALPAPPLPKGLQATLRHYQEEGFHFIAHLAANGFGGILADDMGLGKTVQTLAWLLHAAAAVRTRATPYRALVICPKSVMHGWLSETARFAPSLTATAFAPENVFSLKKPEPDGKPAIVVANYAQLRLNASWFKQQTWDAVILDEAQFIKNPGSQTAVIARSIPAAHRLALTGTPIENRLLDLWSIFAFVQPGLLGPQASFRRQFPADDPEAAARLRRRTRHFMLRRTKAQVAPELPPRTEDEIVVDLEGEQRQLYDAELKRARAQLLGIETDRALDAVRFNVLASLLRLRQICCHPALIAEGHRNMPSAKLDALLERLEELRDEGQQVLVFSQFVELLLLIQQRLELAGITHLLLTGKTENRAELVDKFQSDRNQTVFLLSLKAAGSGLNLTAASYVILCDPWWNPAVEAQAIDRTHRIGQTRPVIAYRLVAADTVEQKILAMQREKAALAAAVVQEESLARVLDLDSLRRILE